MSDGTSDFARVYDAQVSWVYGFLYYRVHNRDLAEDLTQSTFERALRAWPRFDPRRASERTWLLAIARNLLIDHARRAHPEPVAAIDEARLGSAPGPAEQGELSARLMAALDELGEREREVLALRFGADFTGPEIAEQLELSLANVQQIVSRALRRLRASLQPSARA